jgi:hypothetical protein
LGIRQARVLAVELVPLIVGGDEFVDLGHLPEQALSFFLQRGLRSARLVQRLRGLTPLRPCLGQVL